MKIRTKLILIGTIPVAFLLLLAALFLAATNRVDRANNRAIVADEITNHLAELTNLTYEHHLYFEERAHAQWVSKYEAIGKQVQAEEASFASGKEKEQMQRFHRAYRNIGFLFEQYGPHSTIPPESGVPAQASGFRNRITARLLQELAVATPTIAMIHEENHNQAIALSQRIDEVSLLLVGGIAFFLLIITFLVLRAFSVPVRRLNEAFAQVRGGDLSCRINSQSPDELGLLARSFDGMAQRLEESDDSLRRLNLDLEQRVEERTRQLVDANILLHQSEQRYRTIFEESPDGIVLLDMETGRAVEFNEVAHRQLGYEREEFAALTVADYEAKEKPEEIKERFAKIKRLGRDRFDTLHRCKTGEIRQVEVAKQAVTIGAREYLYAIFRDITELRQAQEVMRKYAISLERSNRELEHFAYVASHDLQEPLRKIGSFTELLARKYQDKLDDKAGTYINYIVDGAQRMQILINDLLTFSRVTTKGREFAAVDVNLVVERVQLDLELAVRESGARIVVHPLPTVLADEVQLGQVFQNLIANAIKYRVAGQAPEIEVTAGQREGDWLFAVRDNGIGIDAQHFERVFQLFQRLHTREEYSGTGIGLALCKKIVERHGGRIGVESTPGQGSTFFFTIATSPGKTRLTEQLSS